MFKLMFAGSGEALPDMEADIDIFDQQGLRVKRVRGLISAVLASFADTFGMRSSPVQL